MDKVAIVSKNRPEWIMVDAGGAANGRHPDADLSDDRG
jgi:long-subunit acyl-CoA synthetase (AMP-forming)